MKKFLIPLVVVSLLAASFWIVRHNGDTAADDSDATPVARVKTAPLRLGRIASHAIAFGVVAPASSGEQQLSAPFDGVVRELHAASGARVSAGQALLDLAPSPDAALQVSTAIADLVAAQKVFTAIEQREKLGLSSLQDLATARQAAQDARLRLESLRARGQDRLSPVLAPAAGVVSKILVTPGTYAATGTPLVVVSEEGRLEARLQLEPAEAVGITQGVRVILASESRPSLAGIEATVTAVAHNLDPNTGTIEARVSLPSDCALYLGERVKADVEIGAHQALLAPRSAALPDGEHAVVYTVANNKAVRHEVDLGDANDTDVELRSSQLKPGDLVVAEGNYELTDGMSLQVETKETAP